jgi:4'-phosphopantetheinyl transferase
MKIFALRFESPIDQSVYDFLFGILPRTAQTKISKFMRRPDAERSLLAESMVRYVLVAEYGLEAKGLSFGANQYGKPHVVGCPVHYNVSHSGNWVVSGFDDLPLGIDVEEIKRLNFDIARRFFSQVEYEYIMAQPEQDRSLCFFDFWTYKESVIKAEGKGLSMPLDSFTVKISGDRGTLEPDPFASTWFLKQYPIEEGYKCALCAGKNDFPYAPERIQAEHIAFFFKKLNL